MVWFGLVCWLIGWLVGWFGFDLTWFDFFHRRHHKIRRCYYFLGQSLARMHLREREKDRQTDIERPTDHRTEKKTETGKESEAEKEREREREREREGCVLTRLCIVPTHFFFFLFCVPQLGLWVSKFGVGFCVCDRFSIQPFWQSHSVFVDGACWVLFV